MITPRKTFLRSAKALLFCFTLFGFLTSFFTASGADVLIPQGAIWRYLDDGSNQGTVWRQTNFSDSAWSSGPTQLGYGDGDEAQIINGGPSGSRFATTYFRHTFNVVNRAQITNVALRLMRDDGAVVYLNGTEVFRSNIPEVPALFNTWAGLSIAGSDESSFLIAAVPPALLLSDTNVMAVEVHQVDPGSSDLSFSFELLADTPLGNLPPVAALTLSSSIVASNEIFSIAASASDAETTVTRLDIAQDTATIRTFLSPAGSFAWANSVPGIHEFTARARDTAGTNGLSPPSRLLVTRPGDQSRSIFFPVFSNTNGLVMVSDATTSSNVLHLNRAAGGSRGAAFISTKQDMGSGFVTDFRFRITAKGGGGADGFAFVLQATTAPSLGSGGLGYGGIANSLAIEFDTWANTSQTDPDDHHISVHSCGSNPNSLDESASLGSASVADFSDGTVHQARIEYVPGTLRIFLDNFSLPVLTVNVDLAVLFPSSDGTAWIGFTAGTGASWENHDIWTWAYVSYGNIPPSVTLTTPAKALRVAPGTNLVLSADAIDSDGNLSEVYFFDGFDWVGPFTTPPFTMVLSNMATGVYLVRAGAVDTAGLEAVSDPIVIEVLSTNANVVLFPEFSAPVNLTMQGSSTVAFNKLRLTPAAPSQVGGAWLPDKQLVRHGFETVFQFRITQPSANGADGLAFVIMNGPSPLLGDRGIGIGYSSVANSLAVEFDTFQNPEATDLDANHIGIHSRGIDSNSADESASLARIVPAENFSDGAIHTVVVRYSGGALRISMDDLHEAILKLPLNLETLLALDNGKAWVGLTSATGGEYENHDILMWSFRQNLPPTIVLSEPNSGPFIAPTNILLSVQASDPDGEIQQVDYFVDGNLDGSTFEAPFSYIWNSSIPGTFQITATAKDDFGSIVTSLPITIPIFKIPEVSRVIPETDGAVSIEFDTINGHRYTIQYSGDLIHWTNAVPSLTGDGDLHTWRDTGPPLTESISLTNRFYRLFVSP